jgi:hypothetical protein
VKKSDSIKGKYHGNIDSNANTFQGNVELQNSIRILIDVVDPRRKRLSDVVFNRNTYYF